MEYGYKIPIVAQAVQEAVLKTVSDLSGLKVVEVNVYVQNVMDREEPILEEDL